MDIGFLPILDSSFSFSFLQSQSSVFQVLWGVSLSFYASTVCIAPTAVTINVMESIDVKLSCTYKDILIL